MIYRAYGRAGAAASDWEEAHRRCMRLLSIGLLSEKGIRLEEEALVRNRWGKPALRDHPEVHFSLSHGGGLAACAIAPAPVGIDVERVRPFSPHAARRVCSGAELAAIESSPDRNRAFFRLWTLKESCAKAMGMGLAYPLRELTFAIDGDRAVCLSEQAYAFSLWEDENGFVTATCVLCTGGTTPSR